MIITRNNQQMRRLVINRKNKLELTIVQNGNRRLILKLKETSF